MTLFRLQRPFESPILKNHRFERNKSSFFSFESLSESKHWWFRVPSKSIWKGKKKRWFFFFPMLIFKTNFCILTWFRIFFAALSCSKPNCQLFMADSFFPAPRPVPRDKVSFESGVSIYSFFLSKILILFFFLNFWKSWG